MGRSSWITGTGLLDNFTLKVDEAWFGEDEENDDDRIFLFLRGPASQNGEVVDEEYQERWTIGNNWEVVDEGRAVEHVAGKFEFNENTGIGLLIDSMVRDDDHELVDEKIDMLAERGDAYEAKVYQGLELDLERKQFSFENDEGEKVNYTRLLAADVREASPKRKSSRKKSTSRKKGSSRTKTSPEDRLRKKLIKLAGEYGVDDHDEFVDEALDEYPDVEDFDDLHADMLDEGGEIWLEAHEEAE